VILKSTTNGDVWRRKTGGGVLTPLATGVLAVDPQDSQTLYAAGGPTNIFRGGCESFKSTDGGTTWTCIPLGILVFHLVIDPTSPQTLYAIAGLDPVVRKSTDGGATWADANQGLAGLRPNGLALSPSAPRILYVTTTAGIARSTDAGATWALTAGRGLPVPTSSQHLTELAVDPGNAQVVYTVVQFAAEGTAPARVRVYRSTDGAATWSLLSDGLPRFTGISQLVTDPRRSGVVYLGTSGRGIYELVP
jgi:photosystem II stability/assembly factor-like uncharacterized protein